VSARLLLTATAALAAAALPAATDASSFKTPSGNIGCLYTPASGSDSVSLRCDLASVSHTPQRPASCKLSYGRAFFLYGTGKAKRGCVGDTVLGSGSVIKYGTTKRFGPFTCTSRQSGLSCHSHYGHGFTLSKQKQTLY
jgi:hypothetical protein